MTKQLEKVTRRTNLDKSTHVIKSAAALQIDNKVSPQTRALQDTIAFHYRNGAKTEQQLLEALVPDGNYLKHQFNREKLLFHDRSNFVSAVRGFLRRKGNGTKR